MQAASISPPPAAAAAHGHKPQAAGHRSAFGQLLSELNPLQYLPVVGTIYRALTGDTIPDAARMAGSLVVSGLTGGPVGIALNVGSTALERLLGIDPEKIGSRLLADIGIGGHAADKAPVLAVQPAVETAAAPTRAWSSAELAAYGITHDRSGFFAPGADMLNALELARIKGKAFA